MNALKRVTVVGDGGWGTALAVLLDANGCDVGLWGYDPEYTALMAETRTNPRFLPGFDVPPGIRISACFEELVDGTELCVSAVPTSYLRGVWKEHAPHVAAHVPLVSVSKGLEDGTMLRPTEILAQVLGDHPIAVLSGPNIAREIAHGLPAVTVVASPDGDIAETIQHTFNSDVLRVYRNPDPKGCQSRLR